MEIVYAGLLAASLALWYGAGRLILRFTRWTGGKTDA